MCQNSHHFMKLAHEEALKFSTDKSTQVGCVIYDPKKDHVVTVGTNHHTTGIDISNEDVHSRPAKYKLTEHAERNAIYMAARMGWKLDGCIMYLPWFPCPDCARAIVMSGIAELVCYEPDYDNGIWGEDFNYALKILESSNVIVTYIEKEN